MFYVQVGTNSTLQSLRPYPENPKQIPHHALRDLRMQLQRLRYHRSSHPRLVQTPTKEAEAVVLRWKPHRVYAVIEEGSSRGSCGSKGVETCCARKETRRVWRNSHDTSGGGSNESSLWDRRPEDTGRCAAYVSRGVSSSTSSRSFSSVTLHLHCHSPLRRLGSLRLHTPTLVRAHIIITFHPIRIRFKVHSDSVILYKVCSHPILT